MQNFLKVKGHRPVRRADSTETAQLQAENWDAAQKLGVQSAVLAAYWFIIMNMLGKICGIKQLGPFRSSFF